MIHVGRCVGVADSLEEGNKQPAKEHAAVWITDGEEARCMACGRTQFNLVQRRHHCRACGRVICGACSTHSYRIDSLNKKPVCVYDMCFTRLTGVTADKAARQANDVQGSREPPLPPPKPSTIEMDYDGESSSETDEETSRDDHSMS